MQKTGQTTPPETIERAAGASDIVTDNWLIKHSPKGWRPYIELARMDRPIGTWLLLFPCWWSYALAMVSDKGFADAAWQDWLPFAGFAVGAFAMRGAGCTINDLADRDYDAKVARTATRPLPSGRITARQAFIFLLFQLLIGLLVLVWFNATTIIVALAAMALVVPYPFMKRITYWPQAWLGLTFNWGALVGWTAYSGTLAWPALWLYLGGIFWTLGYDTIYAHQDKEDDALVGVKSSALRLGDRTKPWLVMFYGLTLVCFLTAGLEAGLGHAAWLVLPLLGGHFLWQVTTLSINDPKDCLTKFKSNRFIGWLYLLTIAAAALISLS